MSEFLLNEIARRPEDDRALDREAYSLAAGLGLGLVTLGQGSRVGSSGSAGDAGAHEGPQGLEDLRITERLHRYMVGGQFDANTDGSTMGMDPAPTTARPSKHRDGE